MFRSVSDGIAYGDYYLLGRLGTGGTAEVFLGKRLGDGVGGALFAVKRLLTQFSGNPDLVKTFQDESRIASVLWHPNIAETVDSGINNKQHFLVMEFIHGKDLKSIQQRARKGGSRLPYVASAYIIAAIADALEYAHECEPPEGLGTSIVHRDLSPQKILVSYDGVPKVIDFSARDAKSRGIEGRIGSIKGRFGYLAPEQATSNPADRRSDVFSLGVILYELTTGMAPFRGGSDAATLGKVARASFSPPELVNASMPRVLGKIIERAMQRDPDKRYQTPNEMAEALRTFIRDDGQVIDKGELARLVRELFADDYEREKVRVEQYRRLTPPAASGSGNKPVAMGDSITAGGPEGSLASNTRDERTTANEHSFASIDDDDDTGVNDAAGDPIAEHFERTDTGIADTGLHQQLVDSGVHPIIDTGAHHATPKTDVHDVAGTSVHDVPPASVVMAAEAVQSQDFEVSTEQLSLMPFEPTPSVTTATAVPDADTKPVAGDFDLSFDEVIPQFDDEPTGADDPGARAPASKASDFPENPWAQESAASTVSFNIPPAALGEGPTVVADPLFGNQGPSDSLFQIKTPTAASPSIIFEAKTKVYEESIADLVRRTQPSGFGVEITKQDNAPAKAEKAQMSAVIAAVSPLAAATTVEPLHAATTVQPMHVATVVATPPEKAITEVALPQPKPKKKKGRGLSKIEENEGDTETDKVNDDDLFLDDEAFAKSGPLPDEFEAPKTTANAVPGAMLAEASEPPEDLDEYEEVGRFFSRSDLITLVVAAFMGLLIMTASYVYALNVPLPDQPSTGEQFDGSH